MDIDSVKTLLQAINILGTAGIWVYLRIEKKTDKTNQRLDELNAHIERLNRDVARIESTVTAAPSHGDLSKIYDSLNGLSSTVNQLVGENRGQGDTLRLILNQITQKGMNS
jgi:septal ring factor EnvC (AmiA/AmiB activator)